MVDRTSWPIVAITIKDSGGKHETLGGLRLSRVPSVNEMIWEDERLLVVTGVTHDARKASNVDAAVECVVFGSESDIKWSAAG